MEFIPSKALTVGVELELQLLAADSLDLIDGIQPLLQRYPSSPYVKPEFIQNTVEMASRIGDKVADVHHHLRAVGNELRDACRELGMQICAAGTHAFSRRLGLFTPLPRYLEMEERAGYLGHAQITYATHVHIGVPDAESAIYLMRSLKPCLPILIALSASSPFWRGHDTGFASYRQRILAATRSYGLPPAFPGWREFEDFLDSSRRAGVIETIHDIHWDIRPRPHLGTIEVRVMDAQPTLSEAMQLAALVRTLAFYLLQNRGAGAAGLPRSLPWWIEKDNCYTASRLGFDANCVIHKDGAYLPLDAVWQAVQTAIAPYAVEIGEAEYLSQLVQRISRRDVSYLRQREVYKDCRQFKEVIAVLTRELADDLAAGR